MENMDDKTMHCNGAVRYIYLHLARCEVCAPACAMLYELNYRWFMRTNLFLSSDACEFCDYFIGIIICCRQINLSLNKLEALPL